MVTNKPELMWHFMCGGIKYDDANIFGKFYIDAICEQFQSMSQVFLVCNFCIHAEFIEIDLKFFFF